MSNRRDIVCKLLKFTSAASASMAHRALLLPPDRKRSRPILDAQAWSTPELSHGVGYQPGIEAGRGRSGIC